MTETRGRLRLVDIDAGGAQVLTDVPTGRDAEALLLAVVDRLQVLPLDAAVLRAVMPTVTEDEADLAAERLEQDGRVRRVLIGAAWHLVPAAPPRAAAPGPASSDPVAAPMPRPESEALEDIHQLQVALDIARERLLVMRVLGALAAVAGLVLTREITLALISL